jgi:8-oxo-dGTP pyrophosphatase MutT (NUDIX family)
MELILLKTLIVNNKKYFKKVFIDVGFEKKDYQYAYDRFLNIIPIIQNYDIVNNNQLQWTWPKGRINVDETGYQCALREFEEEVEIVLPSALFISPDYYVVDVLKTVDKIIETRCWLYIIKEQIDLPPLFEHKEVNDRQWIPLQDALVVLKQETLLITLVEDINKLIC